ncbi:MAG: LpxL/LpxP family acyltransferase [Methylobacter sp.]
MKKLTHWAHMEEWSVIWGMRFLLRIYLLFGRTVLQLFLYPVVSYYWIFNRQAREASRAYLCRVADVMPALRLSGSAYWSYKHFISFANAIIDKLAAWSGALSLADVEYHGRDKLLAEVKKGQGIVLLGSHLGNLEVCRVIAYLDKKMRINVLVHTKHAEKFNRLLNQYSDDSRLNLIQVTEITAATSILLSDKIANGELVIITADRTPVNNQQRVSKVDFLGAKASFPQGPFILASLMKCPVYTLFCLKQLGKHVIYFEHFSDGLKFSRKNRQQAMQQTIQQYAGKLQDYCLKEPLQWFNFFDFWGSAKSDASNGHQEKVASLKYL